LSIMGGRLINLNRSRKALTFVELLVTLAIVAVTAALSIVAVQRVRNSASRAHCANNMRQLAISVLHFESLRHKIPEGCGYPFLNSRRDLLWQGGVSWQTSVLPFIEQDSTWELAWQAQLEDPSTDISPKHGVVMEKVIPTFYCPTERKRIGYNVVNKMRWGITSYFGVAGTDKSRNDGMFHKNVTVRLADVSDGTSNTLLIGERPAGPEGLFSAWYASWGNCVCSSNQILHAGFGIWTPSAGGCRISTGTFRPGEVDNLCDVNHYWSLHGGGSNFAFADGSVRFVSYSSAPIIPALATRAGKELIQLD